MQEGLSPVANSLQALVSLVSDKHLCPESHINTLSTEPSFLSMATGDGYLVVPSLWSPEPQRREVRNRGGKSYDHPFFTVGYAVFLFQVKQNFFATNKRTAPFLKDELICDCLGIQHLLEKQRGKEEIKVTLLCMLLLFPYKPVRLQEQAAQ